jgi:hypothetical protein
MKEITAVNWLVIFNLLTGNILDSFRTLHQTVISAGISPGKTSRIKKRMPLPIILNRPTT